MDKRTKIILAVVAVVVLVAGIIFATVKINKKNNNEGNNTSESKLENVTSAEGLENIINKVYEGINTDELPLLETNPIDVNDAATVSMLTGLEDGEELEFLAISQPLMGSQAYSLVLAKVKSGVDANAVSKKMCDNVDTRRWICVEAEKVYATNSGDVVCMVMADADKAKAVYDNFKKQAGNIGKEHERTAEIPEFPEDMY